MNFFKKNYDKNLYNHVKGGTVGQIINFILFIGFAVLAIFLERWSISAYAEGFWLGVMASLLAISVISYIVQYGFTSGIVCFKSTVFAIFESIAAKVDEKIYEKQMAQNGQNPDIARQKLEEIKNKRKPTSKGLNIFLGIAYILLTILFLGIVVYTFFNTIIPPQ